MTSPVSDGSPAWNFSGKPHSDAYGNASASSVAVPTHYGGRMLGAVLAVVAPVGDELLHIAERRLVGDQEAHLVVVQEHDVLGVSEHARGGELATDRDQHESQAGVRALVDVEVVVGRQRVHRERAVQRRLKPRALLALDAVHHLGLGLLEVVVRRA